MKNQLIGIFACFIISQANAQNNNLLPQEHSILKFQPLGLATSSLVFGREIFNKENTKSTVISLGIRYQNTSNEVSFYPSKSHYQFNKWLGGNISIERRYYVPNFAERQSLIGSKSSWGIYLAPALKVDYNQNKFDKSYYSNAYDNQGKVLDAVFYDAQGTGKYLGIMPSANIGLQFTVFQNMYIDLFVGGGVRLLHKNQQNTNSNTSENFNYDEGFLKEMILKEGVLPNGGFSIGIRL